MDVFLAALGCRLNEAELEAWGRDFARQGHRVLDAPERADVVVLNTCAVTAEAGRKSRKLARRLHRQNPSAKLVLTGCFAALEPERAAELAGVDLVISNSDKDALVARLCEDLDDAAMPAQARDDEALYRAARTRAFVKVQDGCRNRCTFCIVTVARGAERSVPVGAVVETVRDLVQRGHREVVLSGVHLGGYGTDIDANLRQLVEAVLAHTDVERLRLSSLEPWDLPDGFFSLWRDPRLCPHLHLPLQSGSDRVLTRMARRTSRESFRQLVVDARAEIPELCLTTDVIVGFPGESAADFEQTLELSRELQFAHIHIFPFSAREGTAAARMSGQVDADEKRRRSAALHELAETMRAHALQRSVGTRRPVLWESRHEDGRVVGLTDNYLKVLLDTPAGADLVNQVSTPLLCAVEGDALIADPQGHALP